MSNGLSTRLQLCITLHQPLHRNEQFLEKALHTIYQPLLAAIEGHENFRAALHIGGHLLDYLTRYQESFLLQLKALVKRGQIEILGGLFYGSIPALLPELDVRSQVEMAKEFWDSYLGSVPRGFFLPELAVAAELPRLLTNTGLNYGFVSDSQIAGNQTHLAVGMLERGGAKLVNYVFNSTLSQTVNERPLSEWLLQLQEYGQQAQHHLVNVWLSGEHWSSSATAGLNADFIKTLTTTTTGIELLLPGETLHSLRPTLLMGLHSPCAPELHPLIAGRRPYDWHDYLQFFSEADTLYRKMLRASHKLHEAIAVMEDEELEENWSDKLATAQRLIFSAQSPDAYWSASVHRSNCTTSALRDATIQRLVRAENILDKLTHGDEEDWLATEEDDTDGDLAEEVWVTTRHLLAWVCPYQGALIRSLDYRAQELNVIDVVGASKGIQHVLLEEAMTPEQYFADSKVPSKASNLRWNVLDHGIDEDGDCSYHLRLAGAGDLALANTAEPSLFCKVRLEFMMQIDAPELSVKTHVHYSGKEKLWWGVELPLRLLSGGTDVEVAGQVLSAKLQTCPEVTSIKVLGTNNLQIEILFADPVWLWCAPCQTAADDPTRPLGWRLLALVPVAHEANCDMRVRLI